MPEEEFIEVKVYGWLPGKDILRIYGGFFSCGKARLGMSFETAQSDYKRYSGGVVDYDDLKKLRDYLTKHIDAVEALTDYDKHILRSQFRS